MPSFRTLASVFGMALLSVSAAQETSSSRIKVAGAASQILYTAINDVDAYSSDMSTLVCVYSVDTIDTQLVSAPTSKNPHPGTTVYNFGITGCKVDEEFVGRCPDLTTFPFCGNYNVSVSSTNDKYKVTAITKQA